MKQLPLYAARLAVIAIALASHSVLAAPRETPLEVAQEIEDLTAGGLNDPAPAIPASDIVIAQRDAPP